MATTIYLVVSQTLEGDIPEAAFTDAGIAESYTTRFADMGSAVYAIKEIPLNPVFTSSADKLLSTEDIKIDFSIESDEISSWNEIFDVKRRYFEKVAVNNSLNII